MKKRDGFKFELPSIVIVGTGNLGSQLIDKFVKDKMNLKQIVSRSDKHKLNNLYSRIDVVESLNGMNETADIYICVVNDDGITALIGAWPFVMSNNQTIIHCSGSVPSTVFEQISDNYGVMWPIQSILKSREIAWDKVPICITSNSKASNDVINYIANSLSPEVQIVSDVQRAKLHMMAVVLNNFTNHLFVLSESYLARNDLSFDLFLPILEETVARLNDTPASMMQTGPAVRNDEHTISNHLELLKDEEELKKIYTLMTKSIVQTNTNK